MLDSKAVDKTGAKENFSSEIARYSSNRLSSEGLSFSSSLFADRIRNATCVSGSISQRCSCVPPDEIERARSRVTLVDRKSGNRVRVNVANLALAKTSATPDADGLFTNKQIIAAIYGAFDQEKLATQKQLTRKYEIANAVAEGSFLDRAEIAKGLASVADAMVARIMSADVPRNVKEDLLTDLAGVPLILENIARAQTRLPRGNGTRPEEDTA